MSRTALAAVVLACSLAPPLDAAQPAKDQPARTPPLRLSWTDNMLTIRGDHLPGGEMPVWYLEAYCRPGSTDRDWKETVIGHATELISASDEGRQLRLRCRLGDGVVVNHTITADRDSVSFELVATNPTDRASQAHWAQPCIRVDTFTGLKPERAGEAYLPKSFIFLDGKLTRLTELPEWATEARYTPGQVWRPKSVPRDDVNPRPLSGLTPSNGLIGCFSADETMLMATAWEPWQELFQGVIVCLHSDFRIGGLKPGETKRIRGKIYLMDADVEALLARYRRDFPEHADGSK
ncbi:MAG TPA: hypothetical protein VML55_23495 [Planctomycetaceae bacterium]|nr:hypothetical protein [Planctomycetaceae bacterium]